MIKEGTFVKRFDRGHRSLAYERVTGRINEVVKRGEMPSAVALARLENDPIVGEFFDRIEILKYCSRRNRYLGVDMYRLGLQSNRVDKKPNTVADHYRNLVVQATSLAAAGKNYEATVKCLKLYSKLVVPGRILPFQIFVAQYEAFLEAGNTNHVIQFLRMNLALGGALPKHYRSFAIVELFAALDKVMDRGQILSEARNISQKDSDPVVLLACAMVIYREFLQSFVAEYKRCFPGKECASLTSMVAMLRHDPLSAPSEWEQLRAEAEALLRKAWAASPTQNSRTCCPALQELCLGEKKDLLELSKDIRITHKCKDFGSLLVALKILKRYRPSKTRTVGLAIEVLEIDPTCTTALDVLESYRGENAMALWGAACINAISHSIPLLFDDESKARFARGVKVYVSHALGNEATQIAQQCGWWRQYFGGEFYDSVFRGLCEREKNSVENFF